MHRCSCCSDPRGKQRKLYLSRHRYRYYKKVDGAQRNVVQVTAPSCSGLLGNSLSIDLFAAEDRIISHDLLRRQRDFDHGQNSNNGGTNKLKQIAYFCLCRKSPASFISSNRDFLLKLPGEVFHVNVNFSEFQTNAASSRLKTKTNSGKRRGGNVEAAHNSEHHLHFLSLRNLEHILPHNSRGKT